MTPKVGYGHRAGPQIGLTELTPATAARRRVLEALETIEMMDTDREFILQARARYIEITNQFPEPDNSNIVMRHTNIKIPFTPPTMKTEPVSVTE